MLFGKCMSQASSTLYSALHNPWCLLCVVRWVSLAEYILILRVYSRLLQMTSFMTVSTRPVFTLRGIGLNRWAWFSNDFVPMMLSVVVMRLWL